MTSFNNNLNFPCVCFANIMHISITFCKIIYLNLFHNVRNLHKSTVRVHTCQGKNNFFKVRELSGNLGKCQGIFEICIKVMDLSGNFLIWLSAS